MRTEPKKNSFSYYVSIIKAAIRGEDQDYTALPIRRAVILLAIPMMLELALESVFAVVDIFFVNRLGVHAVSAVGLTESVITIVYSIAIGLSSAATAVIARRTGEKDMEGASKAAAQTILLTVFISILIALPGYLFAENILHIMGAQPEAIEIGLQYCRIMLAGNVAIVLLFLINGIFRGAGNAAIAMRSLWVGNIVNIILDPILIFGLLHFPEFGVTGAAIATTTGRFAGVFYQIYHLRKKKSGIQIKLPYFKPDLKLIRSVIGIAWPAAFQFIIASASWIFLASLVAQSGSAASAGYQTAIRLIVFFILPAWGMGNAVATLVGQNLGAKLPDRAEQSVWHTVKYNVIFMAFVTLVFTVFALPLVRLLIPAEQTEQIRYAVMALRIISAGYIFYGIEMVMVQAFNGAGDTKTPTWIFFAGFWVFQVPFAYAIHIYTNMGPAGIFMAVPVAETLMAIAVYFLFKKGKWKTVQV